MGTLNDSLYVNGLLSAATMRVSNSSVADASINGQLTTAVVQKTRLCVYGKSGTAATETVPIYRCRGATATVKGIDVGSIAIAVGSATVTVDLKKNGTTILTGVVTLNSASTARITQAGTLSSTSLVSGDWLEIVITATAAGGTIPTGLLVQVEVSEDQP